MENCQQEQLQQKQEQQINSRMETNINWFCYHRLIVLRKSVENTICNTVCIESEVETGGDGLHVFLFGQNSISIMDFSYQRSSIVQHIYRRISIRRWIVSVHRWPDATGAFMHMNETPTRWDTEKKRNSKRNVDQSLDICFFFLFACEEVRTRHKRISYGIPQSHSCHREKCIMRCDCAIK